MAGRQTSQPRSTGWRRWDVDGLAINIASRPFGLAQDRQARDIRLLSAWSETMSEVLPWAERVEWRRRQDSNLRSRQVRILVFETSALSHSATPPYQATKQLNF